MPNRVLTYFLPLQSKLKWILENFVAQKCISSRRFVLELWDADPLTRVIRVWQSPSMITYLYPLINVCCKAARRALVSASSGVLVRSSFKDPQYCGIPTWFLMIHPVVASMFCTLKLHRNCISCVWQVEFSTSYYLLR